MNDRRRHETVITQLRFVSIIADRLRHSPAISRRASVNHFHDIPSACLMMRGGGSQRVSSQMEQHGTGQVAGHSCNVKSQAT